MSELSKRHFLSMSATAIGAMLVSGIKPSRARATEPLSAPAESGLVSGRPKPLKYKSLPGFLSSDQIAPHFSAHYGGALKSYLQLDDQLEGLAKSPAADNAIGFGAMQRSRTAKGNSVLLHELYFDGMTTQSMSPGANIRTAIEQRFGSMDNWAVDFLACAKAASGWAVLVRHPVNGKLYNLVSDAHDTGLLWMANPLVVLDVYEHAYYVDYKNGKSD
jgi:Fe-Mn family superoxide dismutase